MAEAAARWPAAVGWLAVLVRQPAAGRPGALHVVAVCAVVGTVSAARGGALLL